VLTVSQRERVGVRGSPTYRSVFAGSEFTAVFSARVLSDWGDQLARVAIAALVLHRSGSALFTAAVFAVSFLPQVFGQALLGPVADRLPRRTLLVVCDVLRAALLVLLVVAVLRGVPIGVLLVVLFSVELVGAPFFAASQALLVDLFDDSSRYLRASNLVQVSLQLNQVLGVALGGLVVAAAGVGRALELDALSFAVSAVLLRLFVGARAAAAGGGVPGLAELGRDVRDGLAYLRGDLQLRSLAGLAWWLLPAMLAPEAVALPLARDQGADTRVGGVLLAAVPFGLAMGAAVVGRWAPVLQVRRMLPMAALLPLPLLAMALDPPWPVAALLFAVSGAFQAFLVPLMGTFTVLAPERLRGRLNGVAGAGFSLISALSYLVVGEVADVTSPPTAVLIAAGGTLLVLVPLWRRWPARELGRAAEQAYR
jgi:MFS family permease